MAKGTVVARCFWCEGIPEFAEYHDLEWGFPVADDQRLFEKLVLEGFQCGLSWRTILNKRDSFREAFREFEIERVAKFSARDINRLLKNRSIVRHRGKIEAAINNAQRAIELIEEFDSIAAFVWRFEPPMESRPLRITAEVVKQWVMTEQSTQLSKQLRRRGWKYVGPTTMYAFMQAMGLVNDHTEDCDVRARAAVSRRQFVVPT